MKISENVEAADVGQSVWRSSVSRNQLFLKRQLLKSWAKKVLVKRLCTDWMNNYESLHFYFHKNIGREDDDIKGKAVGLKVNEKSKDLGSFVTIGNYFSFLGHSSTSSPENKEGKGVELEQEVGSQLKRF